MSYKTPGVYVKEISVFPPSVAEVETAIPAFIGYTEKAEKKGESLRNKPTKISSLLEYHSWFGGPYVIDDVEVEVDETNNYSVSELTIDDRFYLYDSIRLFFDNGGGDAYIVSVDDYNATNIQNGNEASPAANPGFRVGLHAIEKVDEPTILLFPDAVLMDETSLYSLQQAALVQCNKLQDRVAVFDLKEDIGWDESVNNFRNGIGINNLKYGASYTPWILSAYENEIDFSIFKDNVTDSNAASVNLANITTDSNLNQLVVKANTALADITSLSASITTLKGASATIADHYQGLHISLVNSDDATASAALTALVNYVRDIALEFPNWLSALAGVNLKIDLDAYAKDQLSSVEDLIALSKNAVTNALIGAPDVNATYVSYDGTDWLSGDVNTIVANTEDYDNGATLGAKATSLNILNGIDDPGVDTIFEGLLGFINSMTEASEIHSSNAQKVLYENHSIIGNIANSIKREFAKLPPSGAVAGIYAYVDNNRGVWKAPANVNINSITGPSVMIDHNEQEDLNVDVNAGKSINAIRTFSGKGTLIWGARTLAGNDNEWRYISVRRFFNMVEESVKKSTSWAIFEPNDANTWVKVKTMIDNYLIQKWRDGALQGATPDEAFFVKVGLGQTMTNVDILEGRINVEIGMAAVRPAEFIILKFSHKMIES